MNFLKTVLKKKHELDIFFDKILSKKMKMDEETIKEFKILYVKYGYQETEDKFFEIFPKHKDYELSILLIFFYLFLNWAKVAQVKKVHLFLT